MVYADGGELALNTGVIPYDLNTPLFSDYAHKLRTIWMPPGMAANYDPNATFDFPVGTVITKTFYYPRPVGAARDSKSVARSYDQEAISLAPTEWVYHFLLGLIEKQSGRWGQARDSLEIAAKLNPSAAEVENALGEVAMHDRDSKRAIASFQRAVEPNPREVASKLNLESAKAASAAK